MNKELKCPVCSGDVESGAPFCKHCGWELKVYATAQSAYYVQEQQRLKVAQAFVAAEQTAARALQKRLNDTDRLLEAVRQESDGQKLRLEELTQQLGQARQELTQTEAQLATVNGTLEDTRRQLLDTTAEAEQARREADDLRRQLQQAAAAGGLTGVVCLKNLNTEALCFIPVLDGRHTYGAAPDSGAHHQIRMRLRGHDMPQLMFAVWRTDGRMALSDLSGRLRHGGSPLPASGLYMDGNTTVVFDDVLEIRVAQV